MPRRLVLLLATLGASACNGPWGLLPGGRLDGAARPVPTEWAPGRDHGVAQIETRPQDPYSVNVVFTLVANRIYVNAGRARTRWAGFLEQNPLVRLRLDGAIYELRADRVTDRREIDAFGAAWCSQSFFRRDPRELDEVWLFRLSAR